MTYLAFRNLFQQKFRAALVPAWQMARLDPAQVFRS